MPSPETAEPMAGPGSRRVGAVEPEMIGPAIVSTGLAEA